MLLSVLNTLIHRRHGFEIIEEAKEYRYLIHKRTATDALAGLIITQQLLVMPERADTSFKLFDEFLDELIVHENLSVIYSCHGRLALLRNDLILALEIIDKIEVTLAFSSFLSELKYLQLPKLR